MSTIDRYPVPSDPEKRFEERFREIERQLAELNRARPLGATTMRNGRLVITDDSGNAIAVFDGEGLHVYDTSGVEQTRAGQLTAGGYGLEVLRAGVPISVGDYVFGSDFDEVATRQSIPSTTYSDLATVGPTVTVDVGASGELWFIGGAELDAVPASAIGLYGCEVGYIVSGANTIAVTKLGTARWWCSVAGQAEKPVATVARGVKLSGLNPGSTSIKLVYQFVDPAQSSAFAGHRWLFAQPL